MEIKFKVGDLVRDHLLVDRGLGIVLKIETYPHNNKYFYYDVCFPSYYPAHIRRRLNDELKEVK